MLLNPCLSFKKLSTFNVDSGFPSFESSSIFVTSNFFVFQSSKRITTIPRRMLSLSEYAYISCLGIPEPQKIKPSTFRFLKKLFPHQTKVDDPWMSMNFIMKTLKLSKKFELISSFE
uniref:Uncharacterized protein n=1 Tax=Panagrolaimus davidi TaxID=227884 RepID=A0A914PPT7_9BILA